MTNIVATNNELLKRNATKALTFSALVSLSQSDDDDVYTATTGTYGLAVDWRNHDSKIVLLIKNVGTSANASINILGGDDKVFGANKPLELTITKTTTGSASPLVAITLDSGKYIQMAGARKGHIVITGATADVEVAVVKLP